MSINKKNFIWGLVTQYIYQILIMVLAVLVAPMLLKSKGSASLGAYASLMQFVSYLTLLDLGFSGTLTRYLSQSFSDETDGRKSFINIFNIGRWYLFSACLVMGIIIALSSLFIPDSIGLTGELKTDAVHALLILAVWYGIRFYFTMFNIVLYATQNMRAANIALTIGVIIRFALTILFIKLQYGITGIVLANVIGDFTAAFLQMLSFKFKYPSIKFSFRIYNKAVFKDLFSFGLNTFLINIATRIVQSSTTFVAGIMLGAIAAAHYYSMSTSIFIVFTFINMIMYNLLPGMNQMIAKGNFTEFKKTYASVFKLKMTILLPAFAGFLLFHKFITVLWVGASQYEGYYYTIILCLYLIVVTIGSYNENILIVLGNIKWYSKFQIIVTTAGLILTVLGGYLWGLKGIVTGNLIAITPAGIYVFYRLLNQIDLKFSFSSFMPSLRFIILLIIATVIVYVLQEYIFNKQNLLEVLITAVLFGLLMFFFGIEKPMRNRLFAPVLNFFKR